MNSRFRWRRDKERCDSAKGFGFPSQEGESLGWRRNDVVSLLGWSDSRVRFTWVGSLGWALVNNLFH